jgi:hypothetical protein
VDFEEVAVADGDVGRFRSGGDFPTREPRSRLGRCHARAHDTQEAAAAHRTERGSAGLVFSNGIRESSLTRRYRARFCALDVS